MVFCLFLINYFRRKTIIHQSFLLNNMRGNRGQKLHSYNHQYRPHVMETLQPMIHTGNIHIYGKVFKYLLITRFFVCCLGILTYFYLLFCFFKIKLFLAKFFFSVLLNWKAKRLARLILLQISNCFLLFNCGEIKIKLQQGISLLEFPISFL